MISRLEERKNLDKKYKKKFEDAIDRVKSGERKKRKDFERRYRHYYYDVSNR